MSLYFRDKFFSSGSTGIMNETGESAGWVNLKSAFSTSLEVYDAKDTKMCEAKFRFFSMKWEVSDSYGAPLGVLRPRMSFMNKRFEYDAGERGFYLIESPAFSKEYVIMNRREETIASFAQTSGWMQSGAYCLWNETRQLGDYELIAVIMGVNEIRKRQSSS
ncbi:hypothetical protein BBD42_02905 [Paenibacillus sp. BIHB 4019]|uniref:Uncharacterized protein n=1 Tax=Paenibacillus sp. BIHB 4019 TaxID=1870819 RepID=A0A1B2DCT0_9BACL|nr:hypothetical protein [Paenibacillus sp. BIHB 4019]ANY65530.1 hypothetical protein BBD42_02905 [Paenibacillus sp. BIHB 4019]